MIIEKEKSSIKFLAEKVVRTLSVSQPELVYPYFENIIGLIDSDNSFIKWGAIITVANLVAIDDQELFYKHLDHYFSLLDDKKMVTAANVAGNAWKIVRRYPQLEPEITRLLIATQGNTYYHKNEVSPECCNVLAGHIIDCFDHYFDDSKMQEQIITYVTSHLDNPRKKVAQKAAKFIKNHQTEGS